MRPIGPFDCRGSATGDPAPIPLRKLRMNDNMTRRAERRAPLPALVAGLAGLLPFIGSASLYLLTAEERWLEVLRAYAAVIASFVGALQWGYAVRDCLAGASAWRAYGWSVLPALAAWVSLLLPVPIGLQLLATTLLLCLVVDHAFARARPGPAWLLPLRTALTADEGDEAAD